MVVSNGAEWEDMIVYTSKEEAIAKSKEWTITAIQVFSKTEDGYRPSYKYYLNGELYPLSESLVSKDEKSSKEFSSISNSSEKLNSEFQ